MRQPYKTKNWRGDEDILLFLKGYGDEREFELPTPSKITSGLSECETSKQKETARLTD